MKGFIEKNAQALTFLGGLAVACVTVTWVLSHQIHSMEGRLSDRISSIDERLTVVETVLILQGYPIKNLALNKEVATTQKPSIPFEIPERSP